MTKKIPDVPAFKLHKSTGQAYAIFEGKRRYFGRFDLPESKARYDQAVAEWLANGRRVRVEAHDLTVIELVNAFRRRCESESIDKRDLGQFKQAWTPVVELYGATPAAAFGPLKLKAVRERFIVEGKRPRSRGYVNRLVKAIRFIFRWAVGEELVPVAVYEALRVVPGLKRGKCEAPESEPVRPVADATVDATLPHLSPTVRAMVELQRLTGMRPCEVCIMRSCDVKRGDKTWVYEPQEHKTAYRGFRRTIPIGPRGQAVLQLFLSIGEETFVLQAFIFSPAKSAQEHLDRRREIRETPDGQGNEPGTNRTRNPKRSPGERFTTDSYRGAIEYACAQAWPVPASIADKPEAVKQWRREHRWAPNQLRHSRATVVRRDFGLEAAQAVLGHANANITQVYAERDLTLAAAVALKIG